MAVPGLNAGVYHKFENHKTEQDMDTYGYMLSKHGLLSGLVDTVQNGIKIRSYRHPDHQLNMLLG